MHPKSLRNMELVRHYTMELAIIILAFTLVLGVVGIVAKKLWTRVQSVRNFIANHLRPAQQEGPNPEAPFPATAVDAPPAPMQASISEATFPAPLADDVPLMPSATQASPLRFRCLLQPRKPHLL